jgi:tryptophanyl-tRNA synthetase
MSKSEENPKGTIDLLDDPAAARNKILAAVTDSLGVIKYDPENQPGISNLLTIQSVLTDEPIESIVARYEGKGYGELKQEIGQTVFDFLTDLQAKYKAIMENKVIDQVLKDGAEKANYIANKKIRKVYKKVGFTI